LFLFLTPAKVTLVALLLQLALSLSKGSVHLSSPDLAVMKQAFLREAKQIFKPRFLIDFNPRNEESEDMFFDPENLIKTVVFYPDF